MIYIMTSCATPLKIRMRVAECVGRREAACGNARKEEQRLRRGGRGGGRREGIRNDRTFARRGGKLMPGYVHERFGHWLGVRRGHRS